MCCTEYRSNESNGLNEYKHHDLEHRPSPFCGRVQGQASEKRGLAARREVPALSFKSTRISRRPGDGELAVAGDLTVRGVTRNVVLTVEGPTPPARDPWGDTRLGLSATTKIKRKDFGLTWNAALETGGILVGDEVNCTPSVLITSSPAAFSSVTR